MENIDNYIRRYFGILFLFFFIAGTIEAQHKVKFSISSGSSKGAQMEAVKGFEDSKFISSTPLSLGISLITGQSSEIQVQYGLTKYSLVEGRTILGDLKSNNLLLIYKLIYGEREKGKFNTDLEFIAGYRLNKFNNGPFINEIEEDFEVLVNVKTDNSFVWGLGGGGSYFINDQISLSADARILFGNIKTDWIISGPAIAVNLDDFEKFSGFVFQLMFGVNYSL